MRFKRVYIEISNICNLDCPFCVKSARPPRSMDEAEFRHIIREVAPFTHYVYFHIKGEPLLHPLLPQFLDICQEAGLEVHLTTNGTLLPRQAEMLLGKPALRQVNLSLHSLPFHPAAREIREYMEKVVRFAQRFARERKKYTIFRLWSLDQSRRAGAAEGEIMAFLDHYYPQAAPLAEKMKTRRSLMLEPGVFLSWEEEFEWPSLDSPLLSDQGICQGTRSMAGILADGTVVPCCLDADGAEAMGNIFETPFGEIVASPKFAQAAYAFSCRRVILPLCRRCTYRSRFFNTHPGLR